LGVTELEHTKAPKYAGEPVFCAPHEDKPPTQAIHATTSSPAPGHRETHTSPRPSAESMA
jgi:hypothetical protein